MRRSRGSGRREWETEDQGEEITRRAGDDSDENCRTDEDDEDVSRKAGSRTMTRKKKPSRPTNPLKMKKPTNNLTNEHPHRTEVPPQPPAGLFSYSISVHEERGDVH